MSEETSTNTSFEYQASPDLSPTEVITKKVKKHSFAMKALWALLAINTVAAIFLGSVYKQTPVDNGLGAISLAKSNYDVNNGSATTVYQQQVVNGWFDKDALTVIADQNATIIDQNNKHSWEVNLLLFNILLTLAWLTVAFIRTSLVQTELLSKMVTKELE